MIALGWDLVVPSYLPSHLTGLFVKGSQPRLALMHSGHDHVLIGKHRRGAVVPKEGVFAVGFHEVGLPKDFALKIQCCECSTFEVDVDRFAVGHWRCIATRSIAMLTGVFCLECSRPKLLAFGIDAKKCVLAVLGGRDVDLAIEMDGGRAAFAWQGSRPSQFVFREGRGEVTGFDRT